MIAEPIAGGKEFPFSIGVLFLSEEIVVSQSPLRDCDGVVLQADLTVVIEHRDARGIVMPRIVRFLGKQHVVLAKLMNTRVRIFFWSVVPESEMAIAGDKIGAENAPIVLQTAHI